MRRFPQIKSIESSINMPSKEVVLTAMDVLYPDNMIAAPWSVLEDAVEIDSGFAIFLTGTAWQEVYKFAYDAPGSHTYALSAQDLGHGGGAHNYNVF